MNSSVTMRCSSSAIRVSRGVAFTTMSLNS
jgi:hypothetical protein